MLDLEFVGRIRKLITSVDLKLYIALAILLINAIISVVIASNLYFRQGDVAKANKIFKGALIVTDRGVIEIMFNKNAPIATQNFIKLTESGFYNGLRVHRIVPNVMFEIGDPLSRSDELKPKWGNGGPGYTFADEIDAKDQMERGVVAMVNNGPNTNGSQFFILNEDAGWLNGQHTILGYVEEGLGLVNELSNQPVGILGIPLSDIYIKEIVLK